MLEWMNEQPKKACPSQSFAFDRNLHLQELPNTFEGWGWGSLLHVPFTPIENLYHSTRSKAWSLKKMRQYQNIYDFNEFYTLLQFLDTTNSEFFTQPKSSVFRPLPRSPYLFLNSLPPTPVTLLWS